MDFLKGTSRAIILSHGDRHTSPADRDRCAFQGNAEGASDGATAGFRDVVEDDGGGGEMAALYWRGGEGSRGLV